MIKEQQTRKAQVSDMEERLKSYIQKMEAQSAQWEKNGEDVMMGQERERQMEDLLIQIGFFQHERLVHLIVTVVFALLTMLAVLGTLIAPQPALFLLIVFLLILLVPYAIIIFWKMACRNYINIMTGWRHESS